MTSIDFLGDELIRLSSEDMDYIIRASNHSINSIYWGEQISNPSAITFAPAWSSFDIQQLDERTEYDIYDGRRYSIPCLQIDGPQRLGMLNLQDFKKDSDKLVLKYLVVPHQIKISVVYMLRNSGIIERYVLLESTSKISCSGVLSGATSLPLGCDSWLAYVYGRWFEEWQQETLHLSPGVFSIGSRNGNTGHGFNPAIVLYESGTNEEHGRAWSVMLGYSGNWEMNVERTCQGTTRISTGINSFDSIIRLEPGKVFKTPSVYLGFSRNGRGGLMRKLHRFERDFIIPEKSCSRVLFNSWETVKFGVNEKNQIRLAKIASKIGCELFVVDDGWFGQRDSDSAGLGDWQVNQKKFPHGLDFLIKYVNSLGMSFGLWVEPESVNPDSNLFRIHPDWIYRTTFREPETRRNQYLLNLSLPEVKTFILGFMRDLLSNHNISYVKWDMNRSSSDPDSSLCADGRLLWHEHCRAFYDLLDALRTEFPAVEFEACAGGGGRIDLGILRFSHWFWPSDNTDAYDRIQIQVNCMQFYSPAAMISWVTDKNAAQYPLSYRFHSAMCCGLGIGSDINRVSEKELAEYSYWIRKYKEVRHLVKDGDVFRLTDCEGEKTIAIQYTNNLTFETVVFAFSEASSSGKSHCRVRLRGIPFGLSFYSEDGQSFESEHLTSIGVRIPLHETKASFFLHLLPKC